jgi:hypothetical protein
MRDRGHRAHALRPVPRPPHVPDLGKGRKLVAVIRVSRLWSAPRPVAAVSPAGATIRAFSSDGLDAFNSEARAEAAPVVAQAAAAESAEPAAAEAQPKSRRVSGARIAAIIAIILGTAAVATVAAWQYERRIASPGAGSLTVETTPAGVEVSIAGAVVGRTPLTISLAPGTYAVQVGTGNARRELTVNMVSRGSVVHQLELAPQAPVAPAKASGSLHVQTDLPRMSVQVDGVDRGNAPLTIDSLQAGEHQVLVRGDGRTLRRTVNVKAGETFALVISPIEPSTAGPGWLSVSSPVPMKLRENGQLIGTTETEKLMLPSGEHEIEFANDDLGYQTVKKVTVTAGKTAVTTVEVPTAPLNLNALPWAEVWVDGQRIGETPIANLSTRIGTHDVVFRHPQFGERKESVVVTLRQPARLGVDMRRQ